MTYVYFISNERQSVVKIGIANKPLRRLKTFQTANHEALILLRVIKVPSREMAFQLESALHQKFKKYHIRGEWFKLTVSLRHFIETYEGATLSVVDQFISYLTTIASLLGVVLIVLLFFNGYF